ncbi:MAG: tetrahydrofolate dehydrogenase/cyclohydrolase catalytic domain-containing protein [Microgenomates group bacterium]
MKINGKKIANYLLSLIKKKIAALKKKKTLQLSVFLVGKNPDQLSFVQIKAETAKKLGVGFRLIHLKKIPSFETFVNLIKNESNDKKTTGIIIQQPLPAQLSTESIYDYIANNKEIEGHKKKSPFIPPIGLAVLTLTKHIYGGQKLNQNLLITPQDINSRFFKKIFKNKKIVLIGRGLTGGLPIGKTLNQAGINYININSQTPSPENYYQEADIIITAVGKKILTPAVLKKGVVLINVGLHRENGKLKGDYDEKEIKDIASFYTPTPGGVGPIDVAYLFNNLVEAAKLQR